MRVALSISLSLEFIKNVLDVPTRPVDKDIVISAISNDTRTLFPRDLYVAIQGERYNGEEFTKQAKSIGAYTLSASDINADILVDNTVVAILRLAKAYKELFNLRERIAITGSAGKSTTKNLCTQILSYSYRVHSTEGNLNNEIGVPFTIFGLKADSEILVIEAGMNHEHELERISDCIEPTIAIITNIGHAHIGNLGSREAIARAKLEITHGMKSGILLIPYSEPLLQSVDNAFTVSDETDKADFSLIMQSENENCLLLDFNSQNHKICGIELIAFSEHIKKCLAFSLSAADILGMSDDEIKSALIRYNKNVLPIGEKIGNITVIDDSYNSSPESVLLMLKNAKKAEQKYSAVLGDMLELGEFSIQLHEKIGAAAAKANLSKLYAFGQYAHFIKRGAVDGGMDKRSVFINTDISAPEITAKQIHDNSSNETIFFKASNKIKLGRIIDILKEIK